METIVHTDRSVGGDGMSAASWASIAAGAVATSALTLALLALGAGLGLSSISPWADSGVSAATFKAGTGIYLVLVAVMSSAVGGYLAARLRARWVGFDADEVFFRDTAHGFIAWAFATVLSAAARRGDDANSRGRRNGNRSGARSSRGKCQSRAGLRRPPFPPGCSSAGAGPRRERQRKGEGGGHAPVDLQPQRKRRTCRHRPNVHRATDRRANRHEPSRCRKTRERRGDGS